MEFDELRFNKVGLSSDAVVIFCALDNGKAYAMPIAALEKAEDWHPQAKPKSVKIIHDGFAVAVEFTGGATIDFPTDFVLHMCEPTYAWHKDKKQVASRIGRRIRALRQSRGLTLDGLAARCGIAKPNLSRLEHDKVTPTLATIRRIAEALGVHPSQVFGRKETRSAKAS